MTASVKELIDIRNSGFRIAFIGLFSLIIAFIIYSRLTTPTGEQPVMVIPELKNLGYGVIAITFASLISIGSGIYKIFEAEQHLKTGTNSIIYQISLAF